MFKSHLDNRRGSKVLLAEGYVVSLGDIPLSFSPVRLAWPEMSEILLKEHKK